MSVKLDPHEWIRQTREDRGLRQTDVERQSAELGLQLKISQSHLSKIEKGHSPLAGLGALKLDALRQILGIAPEDWVEKTGLELVTSVPSAPRRGPPVKPRLPPVEIPLEIPPALQEAMDLYGDDYPEMRLEANIRAISSLHRYGGTSDLTPLQWFEVFSANRRWLVKL